MVSRASRSAMASRSPGSAMASRSPGSAMASRSPGSAMASRSPGSAMASRSPGSAMASRSLQIRHGLPKPRIRHGLPDPPWMPSLYPCLPPTSRAPTPPPRFCYYVAGRAVREGEVLLENGPYPPSLIAFTCTCLIIRHTCSSSQLITPALLKLTPHSSHRLILKSHSCHFIETFGYDADLHSLQRTACWVYSCVTYLIILTLSLSSHHQIPVPLWTLETRRLSRIPIRHEPAKEQRHTQDPSARSTIHQKSHLPHARTLTTVVSPYPCK